MSLPKRSKQWISRYLHHSFPIFQTTHHTQVEDPTEMVSRIKRMLDMKNLYGCPWIQDALQEHQVWTGSMIRVSVNVQHPIAVPHLLGHEPP